MRKELGTIGCLLGLGLGLMVSGCSDGTSTQEEGVSPEESFDVVEAELNVQPTINEFAVYAQNSVTLRDRAQVNGGDVGVRAVGTGPFLEPNFELSLINGARVETSRNVIGDSVKLTNRSVVGDVQTAHLTTSGSPTFSGPFGFPSLRPGLPTAGAFTPGSTSVSVNSGQIRTLAPGAFGAVTVNSNARLRLQAGTYAFSSVQLGNDGRIEALGQVVVRVSGRFTGLDRARFVAAAGVSPGSIRVEVAGQNGTTGALSASPKAASFGTDSEITGLWLVPNGTLTTGQRSVVSGALAARDVYVDIDARVTFQSGFPEPACVPANCDDQNPCTVDQCLDGACSHNAAPAGLSCADSNLCNGGETCNGQGSCTAGAAVVCPEAEECYSAGTCNPATGICSAPVEIEGACEEDAGALPVEGGASSPDAATTTSPSEPELPAVEAGADASAADAAQ